jgi:hypothetical protein
MEESPRGLTENQQKLHMRRIRHTRRYVVLDDNEDGTSTSWFYDTKGRLVCGCTPAHSNRD